MSAASGQLPAVDDEVLLADGSILEPALQLPREWPAAYRAWADQRGTRDMWSHPVVRHWSAT